jgi:hypothetical protein
LQLALIAAEASAVPSVNVSLGKFLDDPGVGQAEIRRVAGLPAGQNSVGYSTFAIWAAYCEDPELALEYLEKIDNSLLVLNVWWPLFRDVWKLRGFKDLVRRMGLVDYWRAYGWADFCRPTTGDDFECG